jgi:hypothetical protein
MVQTSTILAKRSLQMRRSSFPALFLLAALTLLSGTSSLAQTKTEYVITGRVVDESNRGVGGFWVFAKPDDYAKMQGLLRVVGRALTDANGNFSIPVGRPARYQLFPEKAEAGYFIQFSPVFRHPAVPIVEVVLTESEKTASAVVTLSPKNGLLVGESLDENTKLPIENARFILCLSSDPNMCWSTNAKNDRGQFRIFTPHVPFTLTVMAQGYDAWFGLNGSEKDEPISIASGTTMERVFLLKRRPEALGRPLNESEKQLPINLPAPIQTSPADRMELSEAWPNRATTLEWQAVEGAAFYKVEVDYCYGLDKSLRECVNPQPNQLPTIVQGTSYQFRFVGAQPGRWRVWAVDRKGKEGFKSPWRTFFHLK